MGGEFLDLILEASLVVQLVLLLLVVASVVSWALIVRKARSLAGAAAAREALDRWGFGQSFQRCKASGAALPLAGAG